VTSKCTRKANGVGRKGIRPNVYVRAFADVVAVHITHRLVITYCAKRFIVACWHCLHTIPAPELQTSCEHTCSGALVGTPQGT
jgi:hypothetical protein